MSDNVASSPAASKTRLPIETQSITVRRGRIVIEVSLPYPQARYCTPALAKRLVERFPDLPYHACVNGRGDTFSAVIDSTDLAHVLEHLTISCMVRDAADDAACFTGTTEWIDAAHTRARIQVSFADDLAALRAYNEALDALCELLALS